MDGVIFLLFKLLTGIDRYFENRLANPINSSWHGYGYGTERGFHNISVHCLRRNPKKENPDIHWREIIGFRNGIVHEYGKTDYTIVHETITNDLPRLMAALEKTSANL